MRLLLLLATFVLGVGQVIDSSSFIVQAVSRRKLESGHERATAGFLEDAAQLCSESLRLYPASAGNVEALRALMTIGGRLHHGANFAGAAEVYRLVLEADSDNVEAYFLRGVSLMHTGDVHASAAMYNQVLLRDDGHLKARLNIAALHHRYGRIQDAIVQYEIGLAKMSMVTAFRPLITDKFHHNLAVAYLQQGKLAKSKELLENSLSSVLDTISKACTNVSGSAEGFKRISVENLQASYEATAVEAVEAAGLPLANAAACQKQRGKLVFCLTNLLHLQKSSCAHRNVEFYQHILLKMTLNSIQGPNSILDGGLMPFDSLLQELSQATRLEIAQANSRKIDSQVVGNGLALFQKHKRPKHYNNSLRLGFISYDFNDHPTAHLVEGIFDFIRKDQKTQHKSIELYTYSYGKNDNSTYRRIIETLSHRFVDISEVSHTAASMQIAQDDIDIMLEMQVHTLGNRLEIIATRPSPLQVNYLVYPGTSGAKFLDSIVADHIALPVEHARYYSEGLVFLPPTYQVSFYSRHMPENNRGSFPSWREALRKQHGLPASDKAVIFCNFNKVDKIDAKSLGAWFGILQRLPHSYLWLLEPIKTSDAEKGDDQGEIFKQNVLLSAGLFGIAHHRIIFAPRIDKALHIARHAAADLFLDTFIYGAHSTATDALFGGLPVLTVKGDSFPSRVGASLYGSICRDPHAFCSALLPLSVKRFQDAAVRLGQSPPSSTLRHLLRLRLDEAMRLGKGFFHPTLGVQKFLSGMQALYDARALSSNSKNTNVVVF